MRPVNWGLSKDKKEKVEKALKNEDSKKKVLQAIEEAKKLTKEGKELPKPKTSNAVTNGTRFPHSRKKGKHNIIFANVTSCVSVRVPSSPPIAITSFILNPIQEQQYRVVFHLRYANYPGFELFITGGRWLITIRFW